MSAYENIPVRNSNSPLNLKPVLLLNGIMIYLIIIAVVIYLPMIMDALTNLGASEKNLN